MTEETRQHIASLEAQVLMLTNQLNDISKDNAMLRHVLMFYAKDENYHVCVEDDRSMVGYDGGDRARRVL